MRVISIICCCFTDATAGHTQIQVEVLSRLPSRKCGIDHGTIAGCQAGRRARASSCHFSLAFWAGLTAATFHKIGSSARCLEVGVAGELGHTHQSLHHDLKPPLPTCLSNSERFRYLPPAKAAQWCLVNVRLVSIVELGLYSLRQHRFYFTILDVPPRSRHEVAPGFQASTASKVSERCAVFRQSDYALF